ncbi:hypothetical protein TPAU25S_01619 [Tsukamurella paurometabola]|uniref:DUF2550 family protein n=1 Tax=Tsukamurella paurometabola (strain ATCC 8368 / DSM 20162 / CCUG 35730 / CIP 100753 / JCM 10117 / KCTC 9821 / NBRC 16120 / NCIMB 702349 / NCTC 13040) TaxID=521096 RepID=D5UW81_TSUPD|nr:DUF2550 domain-containing protein [Tsukamurella paurometabola]ADG77888.1 Protein of unknown function DUF2550 [Tsukamurella paurometabola DSM 20162]SUP29221.1 Protein of uncharacterised function (DUF2550) [Tsukamurella paurometabola]
MDVGAVVFGAAVLILVLLAVGAVLALRLYSLRVAGVPIILRYLPAEPEQGWRHGTLRYDDHELKYYRLSSIRLGPSWTLPRGETEIVGRRAPSGTELDVIDPDMVIVHAVTPDGETELAFARDGLTAFQSWLESRPSPRRNRPI